MALIMITMGKIIIVAILMITITIIVLINSDTIKNINININYCVMTMLLINNSEIIYHSSNKLKTLRFTIIVIYLIYLMKH